MRVRGRIVTVCWFAALVLCGCGGGPAPSSPLLDDATRRAELREVLQADLGRHYDEPVAAGTEDQILKGRQIYKQLCRACHGAGGKGNGPSSEWLRPRPASLVDAATAGFFSDRAQIRIISEGVPGTAMIGWAEVLDKNDTLNVFLYVRSMRAE